MKIITDSTVEIVANSKFIGSKNFDIPNDGTCGISACQKQLEPLTRLHLLFGGSIYGATKKRNVYTWGLYGARARGLAMTLYELMSPRRQNQIKKSLGVKI